MCVERFSEVKDEKVETRQELTTADELGYGGETNLPGQLGHALSRSDGATSKLGRAYKW